MDERPSERLLRTVLITMLLFLIGAFLCGVTLKTSDLSIICLYMAFIGMVSLVISRRLVDIFRKQRFIQVPASNYFDDYDDFEYDFVDDEKPKRG